MATTRGVELHEFKSKATPRASAKDIVLALQETTYFESTSVMSCELQDFRSELKIDEIILTSGRLLEILEDKRLNDQQVAEHLSKVTNLPQIANLIVNIPDQYGHTPLHKAAERGWLETMKVLVNAGAKVEARTVSNWSVLTVAAYWHHFEIAHWLLSEQKADPTILTIFKETLLHVCTQTPGPTVKLIELFISSYKMDVNRRDDSGKIALNNITNWEETGDVKLQADRSAALTLLLKHTDDSNLNCAHKYSGITPLMGIAKSDSQIDIAKEIIGRNPSSFHITKLEYNQQKSALSSAARAGQLKMTSYLCEQKDAHYYFKAAIAGAAYNLQLNTMTFLLDKGRRTYIEGLQKDLQSILEGIVNGVFSWHFSYINHHHYKTLEIREEIVRRLIKEDTKYYFLTSQQEKLKTHWPAMYNLLYPAVLEEKAPPPSLSC